MVLGIVLGMLMGAISGIVFVWLVRGLVGAQGIVAELKIAGEVLGIPTFWFGGPWIATRMLSDVDWTKQIDAYAIALTCTFALICTIPIFIFVRRMIRDIGG